MKMNARLFLAVITICVQTFIGTGCKKETVTVTEPAPGNSQSIIIKFPSSWTLSGCVQGGGVCIIWNRPREEWSNYRLLADEAKGEAWAQNADSGRTQITYYLSEHNLSPALYDKMVLQKKYTFAEDNYIPADLITKAYKDAGITDAPSQMRIPKGDYPVTVIGTPNVEKRVTVTITIKYDRKTGTVTITIIITVKP